MIYKKTSLNLAVLNVGLTIFLKRFHLDLLAKNIGTFGESLINKYLSVFNSKECKSLINDKVKKFYFFWMQGISL